MKRYFQSAGRVVLLAIAVGALSLGVAVAKKKDSKAEVKNEFPNATRVEPKLEMSEKNSKALNKAYEMLNSDNEADVAASLPKLEAIANNPKAKPYEKAVALAYIAQYHYNQDDVTNTMVFNQKALDTNALDNRMHFSLLYQLAQMAMMEEKYAASLAALEQYQKLSGKVDAKGEALRGNALMRLERYDEAIATLNKAMSMGDKPDPQLQELLIASYYEKEDYAGAAKFAEGVLAKEPDNMKIQQHLAQIYLQLDQDAKALALLEKAYKTGRLTSETQIKQLYQLYNFVDPPRYEDSIKLISAELASGRIKPGMDPYRSMADAYYQLEKIDQAVEMYGKAAGFAKDGEMDLQRGHILIQDKEDYVNGKAAVQSALQKGIKRVGTAYLLLGSAEFNMENRAAAIAAFQKARGYPETQKAADTWLKNLKAR